MQYPDFFEAVPRIRVRDPLAGFLGAVEDGVIEYGYVDAVKLAGHSCPTVASAYWMTRQALRALYDSQLPERGALRVEFRDDRQAGVTGVIANVVSMLTGATQDTGFKGLAGRFDRRNLLFYNVDVPLQIRFTRTDAGDSVDVAANLQNVTGDPDTAMLMQRCLRGGCDTEEGRRFGALWQDRVRRILLDRGEDPEVFEIQRAGRTLPSSAHSRAAAPSAI